MALMSINTDVELLKILFQEELLKLLDAKLDFYGQVIINLPTNIEKDCVAFLCFCDEALVKLNILLSNTPDALKPQFKYTLKNQFKGIMTPVILQNTELLDDIKSLLIKSHSLFCASTAELPQLSTWKQLDRVILAFDEWGMIEAVLYPIIRTVSKWIIAENLNSTFHLDKAVFRDKMQWLNERLMFFLCAFCDERFLSELKPILNEYLQTQFVKSRIKAIYDLVIAYPQSQPVIDDLIKCVRLVGIPPDTDIVARFTQACRCFLLHAGEKTNVILDVLINTVHVLTIIDPTGTIRDLCCSPIKEYLRKRDDMVKAITTKLTNEEGLDMLETRNRNDENEIEHWDTWTPEPIEAIEANLSSSDSSSDIVTMLVGAYGSSKQFIRQYNQLLSNRIFKGLNQLNDVMGKYFR
ncbi:hypothetical protein GJ496_005825 [Pomphorhynchus laevis]|nr:hypothetical protein GJ496_005825 [Pomphorhynchus laevis]